MKRVIDISYHNTIVDWKALKNDVDGVIIRMGYRGYSKSGTLAYDRKYAEYRKRCIENGIPYGLYFFPCAITAAEALEEAAFIINDAPKDSPFPIFLDSEVADVKFGNGRADKLSKAERTRFLKIVIDQLRSKSIKVGVYASTSWLNTRLDMTKLNVPVWVAQYGPKVTYKGEYVAWQFTSKATIKGIKGGCDLSRWYGEKNVQNPLQRPAESGEKEVKISNLPSGTVTSKTGLRVRTLPSMNGLAVAALKYGSRIDIYDEKKDATGQLWFAINAKKSRWVCAKYVKVDSVTKKTAGGIIV
jgi:GH25 family lysozyme M1 (1,4-beta-N-acetylmuramidase)